ncbi:expansin family protein [Pseudohyphozyma bogoriensis]|nr:expansin family protein [Pseudohyphozyma bogoriensis]
MFAKLAAASLALASLSQARPIADSVLLAVETALTLPNTTQTSNVSYYYQAGNAGACGLYSEDTDVVVGLPLEFYNDTGAVSPYCGSYIEILNPLNNITVAARIADASATPGLLSLSIATWRALDGDATDLHTVNWTFANATETAAAKAALSSVSLSPSSTYSASSEPASSSSEEKKTSSAYTSTSAYVAPAESSKTTTTSQWVAPSTTAKKTTTTSEWVAPTTTTTTSQWVAPSTTTTWAAATTTKASTYSSSSSSSGSGSFSGTATYFYQNGVAGACGSVNSDSAYIVALDSALYGSGGYCGKSLTIYANGKSVTATVADECPTCSSEYSLDLSVGAFTALASTDAGVAAITWSWN